MPSTTTTFFFVYVLKSLKDNKRYVGFTDNLKARLAQHEKGEVFSTAPRRPFSLIYFEARRSKTDATRRERYLKTTGGRRFLAKRLKDYLFFKL